MAKSMILTMHKVGSTSLMQALREVGHNPDRGYEENIENLQIISQYDTILTSFRDPIARNISWFFEHHGGMCLAHDLDLEELKREYFLAVDHDYPLKWFDEVYEPITGINVYNYSFPPWGWICIDSKFFIIRTEKISTKELSNAFDFLFDKRVEPVQRTNTTDSKPYGNLYKEFRDWVKFPRIYVQRMYDNKFVHHFFNPLETRQMQERWLE